MSKTICGICSTINENPYILIKEMMFGMEKHFKYFTCLHCGCLQIERPPENIEIYYPDNYYSFNQKPLIKKNIFSRYLSYCRTNYFLFGNNLLGKFLAKIHHNPVLEMIGKTGINKKSKVLDVGCGTGHILYSLSLSGMKNILGIDPYLLEDIRYNNGLTILKKELTEIEGGWDLIMMHHVLEHLENQVDTLHLIREKLVPNGIFLIRIPTCSSEAWEIFQENWVQADAPRHFFLHSLKSIEVLSQKTGFSIEKIVFDSSSFQFWGSIQYSKNIPLMSENSYLINPKKSIFSKEDIKIFNDKAKKLNKRSQGDQMCVFLRKIN